MATFDSKFMRSYGVVGDQYGIDPLRDKMVPYVLGLKSFHYHEVQQDERGAPDLIAKREYGSEDLWWYILVYNGIALYKHVVEGVMLKIPEYASILQVISYAELAPRLGNNGKPGPRIITI